jgi:putative membrane protein
MMYYYNYWSPFHFLGNLIGWFLIILIILWILRAGRRGRYWHDFHRDFHKDSAMDILREKYAKGEISKEEFEVKKKDLSS